MKKMEQNKKKKQIKKKKKTLPTRKYSQVANKEVKEVWDKIAVTLFKEATATITIESPKVSADIEIKTDPESIIELKEIITKQQAKMDKKFATIANVDYNDIKDDPKIKEAFEVMSKAHLTYARKMPLYVREVLNEHLKKASETLEFDAAKLQKTLENV